MVGAGAIADTSLRHSNLVSARSKSDMSNQKMIMLRLNSFGEHKRSRDSSMAEADEGVENKTCRDGAIDTRPCVAHLMVLRT
ncbi:Endo-xylogalacturonan hydrolase A [Fusarium oxysporum f. sp. albedinis]|nr:Endo-xylogalacturonan hydrolase A [Fusarium oxysporum f. sp. albedinis]